MKMLAWFGLSGLFLFQLACGGGGGGGEPPQGETITEPNLVNCCLKILACRPMATSPVPAVMMPAPDLPIPM